MNIRLAVAAMLAVACSSGSKGDSGPGGPSGPIGASGPKGDPGVPVLSASLDVGSTACPSGGSQFVSASGTTYACNGAPGVEEPSGPSGAPARLVGSGLPWSLASTIRLAFSNHAW